MTVDGSSGAVESRIQIRVGDVDVDLTGTAKEVDSRMLTQMEQDVWSTALASIRGAREAAIEAAREAARAPSFLSPGGGLFRIVSPELEIQAMAKTTKTYSLIKNPCFSHPTASKSIKIMSKSIHIIEWRVRASQMRSRRKTATK